MMNDENFNKYLAIEVLFAEGRISEEEYERRCDELGFPNINNF